MFKRIKPNAGFSLIELMVVVAIIGILSAIAIPRFTTALELASKGKIQADLNSIDTAYAMYLANSGVALPDDSAVNKDCVLITGNYLNAAPVVPAGYSGVYVLKGGRAAYKNGMSYQYATDAAFTK